MSPPIGMDESRRRELEAQFSRILAAEGAALSRVAASYARNASDRDDLVQEIAIALWRALPSFRGDCSERTFLFRIAHNRGIDHVAKRRPVVSLEDEPADPEDPRLNAEAALSSQQEGERLLRAIRELPVIYREVIVLALEDLEYREIAQVLGITESNVGVRLNRAQQMLKKHLEEGA